MFPDVKRSLSNFLGNVQVVLLKLEYSKKFQQSVYVCEWVWHYSSFGERIVTTTFIQEYDKTDCKWKIRVLEENPICGEEDPNWR